TFYILDPPTAVSGAPSATLPGTYDPVVERELRALGSRPPGPHLDPTNPARQAFGGDPADGAAPVRHLGVEPLIRASHANLARPVQGSEESVSVGSDYYGSMFSLYRGRTFSMNKSAEDSWRLSSHVPPSSTLAAFSKKLDKDKTEDPQASKTSGDVIMTPKLPRAGPKITDKVRAFEEWRKSLDLPGGAACLDSDDSGKKTGGPSKEEGRVSQGVAQKRAAFQHRASSLEDKTTYSQRVQNKFAEELQRIKKLVGKPSLKKAYSTEQLSQRERTPTGKIEPIPQHAGRGGTSLSCPESEHPHNPCGGRTKGGKSTQKEERPFSPAKGSSDESYLSADEEPGESPRFVKPLRDITAPCGSEVKLDCIIAGSPSPTVTWRKNNVELRSDAFCAIKTEGEKHTLLIKELRPHNAGSYCVTAANEAGTSSCSAFLHIQPGEKSLKTKERTITSIYTILFPFSESSCFDPFKVAPRDQAVAEGQEVILLAKFSGNPKPMVFWLKDRETVKTGGRFVVREREDGTCEMRISSAQRSDAGLYLCKIASERGTKQVGCRVEVKGE
uniref:Ig-like domain-containing protein n=1 Tax=Cyprinodon variegatus TaxID=28743 RepID=A0A3Q2GII2_CYPVA